MKKGLKISAMPVEELSAGICDDCIHPRMERTGCDPKQEELICPPKGFIIEPELPEDRVIECEFYSKKA